ncbi:hypothetical protein M885DRAFT_564472 [Pelagophyceae sp. CCMP2097]|nr:hypothetical protein M885DRAFT_564472 [Pelagophyceae sp. CCMP2097]
MQVFVRTLAGGTVTVDVDDAACISAVFLSLADSGEAPDFLSHGGVKLDEGAPLSSFGVSEASHLEACLRVCGGGRRREARCRENDSSGESDLSGSEASDTEITLITTDKEGDLIQLRDFGNGRKGKRRAKKAWRKAVDKRIGCVWTRDSVVKKWTGEDRVVTFLIGVGYGHDDCDLGPLEGDGDLSIFRDDGERQRLNRSDDDVDSDDSGSDSDDCWTILKVDKDHGGISFMDFAKKRKARKRFEKMERKGRTGILIKEGGVKDVTKFDGERDKREITFLIGVAAGRGKLNKGEHGARADARKTRTVAATTAGGHDGSDH